MNATPRAAPESPAAVREVVLSCTVTAVIAAQARPVRPIVTPTSAEPSAAYPLPIARPVTISAVAALAIPATIRAAVSGACRPTTLARSTSDRPVCSSALVCRAIRRMFMRAASRYR